MTGNALITYTFPSTGRHISITLDPKPGHCSVLVGANGSGKTTLLRAMAGAVLADGARVALPKPVLAFTNIERQIHLRMTALENIRYLAALMGVSVSRKVAENALALVDLAEHSKTRAARLSKGQKKRLILAIAISADWGTIILDEPTNGLDLEGTELCIKVLSSVKDGGASIILSSHDPRVLNDLGADLFAPSDQNVFCPITKTDIQVSEKYKVTLRDGQAEEVDREGIAAFVAKHTDNIASLQSLGVEIGTR